MAKMSTEIVITQERRPCIVNGQRALFHRWEDVAGHIPSLLANGGSGGITRITLGIIEREDGSIHECYPAEILFCDSLLSEYSFTPLHDEGAL